MPKGVPRRNAQPRAAAIQPSLTPESQPEEPSQANNERERVENEETIERQPAVDPSPISPPSTVEPVQDAPLTTEDALEPTVPFSPQTRSVTPITITDEVPGPEEECTTTGPPSILAQDVPPRSQISDSPHGEKRKARGGPAVELRTEDDTATITEPVSTETGVAPEPAKVPRSSIAPSSPANSRKRRKVTPDTSNTTTVAQSRVSISPVSQSTHARDRDVQSQSPEDLFRSATTRAASVSRMANSIDDQTRAIRQASISHVETEQTEGQTANAEESVGTATTQSGRKRRKKTVQEQAAEVIANAVGGSVRKSRKRNTAPDDAENYEINPDEMTMGSLMKNNKIGKKSALEAEMEANWTEILQRRQEDRDKALEAAQSRKRKAYSKLGPPAPLESTVAVGPQQMIVNGKIVVVTESREIDRNAQLTQAAVLDESNVREDKDYYKRVNQNTVGVKAMRGKKFRWDDESTQKFFKGLRMFGTDFMMIANMFPGLDRKQIKMKFIREENLDKAGVMAHLQNREAVDLEEYSEVSNIEFQDVTAVEEGIKAEEQRLRAEDNERRKREGFVVNEADVPLPSREGEGGGVDGSQAVEDGTGRFAELAADVMAPKKKQRKTNASSKKRGPKVGIRSEGGVEEVLGSIDEVQV